MADTASTVGTATGTGKPSLEFFRANGIPVDGPIPPASAIDLATLDITDPELWRRDAVWDRFGRMRKEDPVHLCPG